MTHFKIISTGWNSWPWIQQTLKSIHEQEHRDFDVCVVDDNTGDDLLSAYIETYCRGQGWKYILQDERRGACHNQVAAIRMLDPDPEDVLVFLDADGDRFAHRDVLAHLEQAYADGSRLVYSKYESEPPSHGSIQSMPYPQWVIDQNAYRAFARTHGIYWNHLRTFKAELFLALDDTDLKDDNGNYFKTATDQAFMFPCLELARGRVKWHDEVLMIYRADHELSDWRCNLAQLGLDSHVILTRPKKC